MYDNSSARTRVLLRHALGAAAFFSLACALTQPAYSQGFEPESVVKKISGLSEKLELTTNTSRILTLDKNIPRVQVNNPELVKVTPLSAKDIQISAKKAGVTQVNLWDEDGKIYSIERVAPLLERARQRLKELEIKNVRFRHGDGSQGWPAHAPYDGILVAAAPHAIPDVLLEQLAPGGRMVVPIGAEGEQELMRITREDTRLKRERLGAVAFVPLVQGPV